MILSVGRGSICLATFQLKALRQCHSPDMIKGYNKCETGKSWLATRRGKLIVASDMLISLKRLTLTTLEQLRPLTQELGRIATYAGRLDDRYSARLDGISGRFRYFYIWIEKRVDELSRSGPRFNEPNPTAIYGHPVSGTLSETALASIRQYIRQLQHDGRYGSAYFLKHHHLCHFPAQFETKDQVELDTIAQMFIDVLKGPVSTQTLGHHPPQSFWDFVKAPLFPHMMARRNLAKYFRGEKRIDCLGRSISHVLHDHQMDGSNATWRDEDLYQRDILGRTAIFYACRQGSMTFLERMYKAGADDDVPLVTGMCPLHVASSMGFASICRRMCEESTEFRRVDEDIPDCTDRTPIMCAVSADQHDTVDFFLSEGRIPRDSEQMSRIFVDTVKDGHLRIMMVLLKYVKKLQAYGETYPKNILDNAFWRAEFHGHYDVMVALSGSMKMDHNKRGDAGRTTLGRAAARGDAKYVKFLLGLNTDLGGEFCRFNKEGFTDTSEWTVDPNAKDDENKCPLILATEIGSDECIKLLLAPRYLPVIPQKDLFRAQEIAQASGNPQLCNTLDRAILDRIAVLPRVLKRRQDASFFWIEANLEKPQFRREL